VGASIRQVQGTSKTRNKVYSSTTNQTVDEREILVINGVAVDVTPKQLIPEAEERKKSEESEQASIKQSNPVSERKEDNTESKSDMISSSMHSGVEHSDSLSQISDDTTSKDEAKAKVAAKALEDQEKKDNLDELIEIELTETGPMTLFFMPSRSVSIDAPFKAQVDSSNERYVTLKREKLASDSFKARGAQTFNFAQKIKETSTESYQKKDFEAEVTEWQLYDSSKEDPPEAYEVISKEFEDEVNKAMVRSLKAGTLLNAESFISNTAINSSQSQIQREQSITNASAHAKSRSTKNDVTQSAMSSSRSMNASQASSSSFIETTPFKPMEDVELPPSLLGSFKIIERILTQNMYLEEQILYRNYPKVEFSKRDDDKEIEEEKGKTTNLLLRGGLSPGLKKEGDKEEEEEKEETKDPHLMDLFKFECQITDNRNVSCADWNALNSDLLAVGYGEYSHTDNKEGILAFWTLKSPKFPERIIRTPSGIMSCQFSQVNPNIIAVGCYDGVVAIYDVRQRENKPVADSREVEGRHIDIVWETQWISMEKGESLVSIGADGRVVEWSIKKGLEYYDLLHIKKPSNPQQKEEKEASVFRQAVGFSFDFPKGEHPLYFIGTEEGTVHKCSISYNDDLETYWGHAGPVYRVRCSPFWSHIMLTCSADWTAAVWNWRSDESPVLSIHSLDLQDSINDIQWSPQSSTIFSLVANDGRIEIWDLAVGNITPTVIHRTEDHTPRTMVRFCNDYPVLVSGNSRGIVEVFRMKNMDTPLMTLEEQKQRLYRAVYPTGRGNREQTEDQDEEEEAKH
jgi:WD40 repeat protein